MKPTTLFICLFLLWVSGTAYAQKDKSIDPELQQLKAKLAVAKHDTDKIIAYREIGLYFRDSTQYADSALVYGLKAGQLAKVNPHYSQTPRVWNTIALSYKKLYDLTDDTVLKRNYFELSEKHFKKCMYEAKQMGNNNQMLAAWFYLIDLYRQSSNRYNEFKNSFELINYLQKKAYWNNFDSTLLRKTYKSLCINMDNEIGSKKHSEYLSNYEKFVSKEDLMDYEKFYLLRFEQQALTWQKEDEKKLLEEYQTLKNKINIKQISEELEEYLAQYYFRIQKYEKSFQLMANFLPQNNVC